MTNPPGQPAYPPAPGQPAYPPAPGPVAGDPGKVRLRGRIPRILGWVFLALAIALFAAGAAVIGTKSLGKVNGFHRIAYPQGGTVSLDGSGKWIIYLEASNADSLSRIPFQVQVLAPSGNQIPVQYYGNPGQGEKVSKFTYDYNGHHGIAAYQFNAPVAGSYQIRGAGQPLPPGADLAVGRDITTSTVVGGALIGGGVLFGIAAIVLLIVGYVKRSRHKNELRAGAFGAPAWGVPGGYAGPPPGYTPPPGGYGAPPSGGYGAPPPGGPGGYSPQPGGYGSPPPGGYTPPPESPQQPNFGSPPPESGS
jgi:hypothetical protein